MYYTKQLLYLAFLLSSLAGVLLHFAYPRFPSVPVSLFAPVSESLWEHVKLIFWPGLVAALLLSWGRPRGLLPWLLALLVACVSMLVVAYLFHVVLNLASLPFDIGLYFASMALLFFLAPRLSGPYDSPLWLLPLLLTLGMILLLARFTASPPSGPLFADNQPHTSQF